MEPQVTALDFGQLVLESLPYEPTSQQVTLVAALARFYCTPYDPEHESAFVLSGYAGTGKTSLTGALVKAIKRLHRDVVLLAPTGRAAKVFSAFASHPAYTIHRKIYTVTLTGIELGCNPHRDTLFIVDEASMIGDGDDLLNDLIQYVYSGERCRLLLLGDTAQLPPVGLVESPAMSVERLRSIGLKVSRALMTQTVRQSRDSGILYNATWLRRAMAQNPLPVPQLTVSPFSDVKVVEPEELEDLIGDCYRETGQDGTIVITRSNRRATAFNTGIRDVILGRTEELCRGELLMVAKNNYLWSRSIRGVPFIANGDVAVVEHINSTYWRYGMRWADVTLMFPHRDTQFDATIMLDTLVGNTAALPDEQLAKLANEVLADPDFAPLSQSPSARRQALRTNPYFNALQVKFAYAVTCHKAQGGQWENVFVDMAGIAPEAMGMDFYRWLYTAITRSTRQLYLISPTLATR